MFGNSGYVGASRSVRSQNAIDSYEVPLSLLDKNLINSFIREEISNEEEKEILKKTPVSWWKFIAKKKVGNSSYHHTGKYFNKTDHYDLSIIAERILELGLEKVKAMYDEQKSQDKQEKEDLKKNYSYGYIRVQEWGGTRKHPKIIGYSEEYGIVINGWLYYTNSNKYKISANKVEAFESYDTYEKFVKKHPEAKENRNKWFYNRLHKEITK